MLNILWIFSLQLDFHGWIAEQLPLHLDHNHIEVFPTRTFLFPTHYSPSPINILPFPNRQTSIRTPRPLSVLAHEQLHTYFGLFKFQRENKWYSQQQQSRVSPNLVMDGHSATAFSGSSFSELATATPQLETMSETSALGLVLYGSGCCSIVHMT